MRALALGAALVAALAGCAHPPPRPDPLPPGDLHYLEERLAWLAEREVAKGRVTGLSIAVVDRERVLWADGFGWADLARRVAATPRTVYRAGSISKLLTATEAMRLVEAGRLDLDAPLERALPGFRVRCRFPAAGPITARSLLTHHSGLPSDLLHGMWTRRPHPFREVVPALREEYVANPPGVLDSYSNLGFTVLGAAIAQVTGRDFAPLMDDEVLRPLGMASASFAPGIDRSAAAAKAYRGGHEVEEPALRDVPAGGLNASVLDLARFMQMVLRGGEVGGRRVLRPESVAEMLRPQNDGVALDAGLRVGLGWALSGLGDIDIQNAGPVAHHAGATINHHAQLIILPRHGLGVVVMADSAGAGRLVSHLAVEAITLALESRTGIRQPPPERVPLAGGDVAPAAAAAFEGRYASIAGLVTVRRSWGGLRADIAGHSLRLVPRTDGLLGVRYRLLGIFPVSLGTLEQVGLGRATVAGREVVTARLRGRELIVAEKVIPRPIPLAWLRRAGAYEVVDPGDDMVALGRVRVAVDGGLLVVEYAVPPLAPAPVRLVLVPTSDDEAVIAGIGRGMGETVRVVTVDGFELLRASGYLLRRAPR